MAANNKVLELIWKQRNYYYSESKKLKYFLEKNGYNVIGESQLEELNNDVLLFDEAIKAYNDYLGNKLK